MGIGLMIGCCTHGYIIIRNNNKCIISRRYLCQSASLSCGVLCLLLTMAHDYNAFALFAWVFGICYGGYCFSLKMYTYELVKTKIMERAWGFICAAQCLSILVGTPIAGKVLTGFIFLPERGSIIMAISIDHPLTVVIHILKAAQIIQPKHCIMGTWHVIFEPLLIKIK